MAVKLRKTVWSLHKILSYFVFLQIFFWVLGGIFFATVPFKALVKGGDYVTPPASASLPANWVMPAVAGVQQVQAVNTAQGTLVHIVAESGEQWFTPEGLSASKANAKEIATFAQGLYQGPASEPSVTWQAEPQRRMLGLVDETAGRAGLWVAAFEGARLYFGPRGDYQLVRSDYWVWYDALWRLHIMDYGEGDDFNNTLLRVFAWLAFAFVLTGLVLSYYAFTRTIQRGFNAPAKRLHNQNEM
ncbi:hypothetical protein L1F30_03030 [Simiduia sp. 21SJ11W-1]|uniref:hypothetical protein n=1 Tax=Simiduia sp. 21SJ11W-1 TaxID=2909669 RepID=UPI00209DDB74|nr:hypothetical protein [Simiduia sp. 21SJ11W-1]UTA48528.1 hypothetical protein L1F30_03030 [Simiduia sp. 21SJ11W-1]